MSNLFNYVTKIQNKKNRIELFDSDNQLHEQAIKCKSIKNRFEKPPLGTTLIVTRCCSAAFYFKQFWSKCR